MMDHREASRLLPDLLSGPLPDERRAALEAHVEECTECREWSETYGFLTDALSGNHESEHPSSEQLAHLAVDAELLTAPERDQLAEHLEGCADCRRELELSREALVAARRRPTVLSFPLRRPSPAVAARLALAASLILALAVTFVALRPGKVERGPVTAALPEPAPTAPAEAVFPEPSAVEAVPETTATAATALPVAAPRESSPVEATPPTAVPGAVVAAAGERPGPVDELRVHRAVEIPDVIDASAMAIENGSVVTLRAGEMVVLGDGFSIGSSATLGVNVASNSATEEDSESHS